MKTIAIALIVAAPAFAQDALVSTDWAWEHLKDPAVRFLDVSVDPGVYE